MKMKEATMWDACWNHQGRGNETGEPRIYLHLLFVPFWMIAPNVQEQQWNFEDEHLQEHIDVLARASTKRMTSWQYIKEIQDSIQAEYNGGKEYEASDSPLRSWIKRVRKKVRSSK